jgi:hypothetical protein
MRTLLVLVAAAVCANALVSSNQEILDDVRAKHWDELPQWVRDDFTIESLRKLLSPSIFEAVTPDYNPAEATGIDPSVIIEIGKDAWQFIKDNTPVVNASLDWGGAVPKGVKSWTSLAGWKDQQSKEYMFRFKSIVGSTLTEFKFVFSWKYNGRLQNASDAGVYVSLGGITAKKIYAYLTEHINVDVKILGATNYGKPGGPVIGGIDVLVSLTSCGYFEKTTVQCNVELKGDGTYKVISCDQNQALV